LFAALGRPTVGPLLVSRSVFMVAFVAFQMIFPLWALERLGADARTTSYLLAYIGVMIVLVQGVAIGFLTARVPERRLLVAAVVLMAVAQAGWAWAPSYAAILVVLPFMALAGGTFTTVNISVLSKSVHRDEVGGTMGFSSSVDSLSRVVAPPLGAMVLQRWGTSAPGVCGAAVLVLLLPYVLLNLAASPE
jgi:DHA1 family tetracycline resistance protein-like MFS transporter